MRIIIFLFLLLSLYACNENVISSQTLGKKGINYCYDKTDTLRWDIQFQQLREFTDRLDTNKFNGCIAVLDKGQLIYCYYAGFCDRKSKKKIDTCSIFQLASVSKPFTATAILQLYEKGLIRLDDPVKDYIPSFPYPNILIHHLLRHTSGLFCHINDPWIYNRYFPKKTYFDNDDLLALIAKHKIPLGFKPGASFHYTNTGYAILASIVEKVSGKRFEEYMRTEIFEPIGMKSSFIARGMQYLTPAQKENLVLPYKSRYQQNIRYYDFHDGVVGDKGMFSTILDLAKFDNALYEEKVLKSETLNAAFAEVYSLGPKSELIKYGFGWRIFFTGKAMKYVYHQGFWNGYNPSFIRFIERHKTLLILHNNSVDFRSSVLVRNLSRIMLCDQIEHCDSDCFERDEHNVSLKAFPGN